MRILIDGRFWGLENAGLGRYTINLISSLGRADKQNRYGLLLRKKYFNQLTLPKNWLKILADFRHYTFTEQIKLPVIISSFSSDLVHFPHFNIPLFFKGNFIVTIHDMLWHKQKGFAVTTLPPHIYAAKYVGYKLVFSKAIYASKKIIVPSQSVKKDLLEYYKNLDKNKIVVTYEGVDKNLLTTKEDGEIPKKYGLESGYFIYVGNAYPHKNLSKAIEAIIHLNKVSKKKILFAIACARDAFLGKLEDNIRLLKAGEYVKILGLVPDKDLGILYKNSLGLLYPSFSEGFGLQGLEAMKSGTMALVSDIAVFKEVYEDNALYFNPESVSSIVERLQEVIKMKPYLRDEIIERGKNFVKKYSWDKMAKETLDIYENCARLR